MALTEKPAKLPEWRWRMIQALAEALRSALVNMGKVRNTFDFGDFLVLEATDGLSCFDFCLGQPIPRKGEVLTAITHFWGTMFAQNDYQLHFKDLEKNTAIVSDLGFDPRTSMAVNKAIVIMFEFIYRAHLGGSVFKGYQKNGQVAGIQLPSGVAKWSEVGDFWPEFALFTPSTKAADGHDINISVAEFMAAMDREYPGGLGSMAEFLGRMLYQIAYEHARSQGILILDTKLEMGLINEILAAIDELFTPDSSRFVDIQEYERAMAEGRDPQFQDKEIARAYLKQLETPFFDAQDNPIKGVHKLDPKNPEHVAWVQSIVLPDDLISELTATYLGIFERLTGMPLDEYQEKCMLIH